MDSNPYQSLVSLLSNVLEAHTTAFFIFDSRTRELKLTACQSLSSLIHETVSLPLEQSGILSQVHKVGHKIHLDKLQDVSLSLPATVPFYREGESYIKGIYAIPIGDSAGVLYVDTKYSWGFNDKQQKLIHQAADLLNQLLERQECLGQQQSHAAILDFWYRVDEILLGGGSMLECCRSFVDECTEILDIEYGFLALRASDQPYYQNLAGTRNAPQSLSDQRFLVRQGLIGRVFEHNKALFISKLNPHAPEHFLFTPSEGLPHHGTLWILPMHMSLGHTLAMVFLSRSAQELKAEHQRAATCALHSFSLHFDRFCLQEECDQLRIYDLSTGILNGIAFSDRMEELLATSMQHSTPFAMALMQFEPWHMLYTTASPKRVRQCQQELASSLSTVAPSNVLMAQISENRFGFLFPQMSFQEANPILTHLMDRGKQILGSAFKGMKARSYLGLVGYPQDGTRIEELWPLAYRRLHSGVYARIE
jgi:GGDEF domain-containing protein